MHLHAEHGPASRHAPRPRGPKELLAYIAWLERELRWARARVSRRQAAGASMRYATLDQLAALVNRRERSLRHYLHEMPPPAYPGRRGRPALWLWKKVRPWLAGKFNRPDLREDFPLGRAEDEDLDGPEDGSAEGPSA